MKAFFFGIVCLFIFSCTNSKSSASGGASSSAKSGTANGTNTSTGTDGGVSGLESLLSSLGGGTTSSSTSVSQDSETGSSGSDASVMQWSTHTPDMFYSFQLYAPQANYLNADSIAAGKNPTTNYDTYDCPGDSFLTGWRGAWDGNNNDRIMQAGCQFFADGTGKAVKKQNCQVLAGSTAKQLSSSFTCPAGQFLAGFSAYYVAAQGDRSYQFECCDAVTDSGGSLDFMVQSGAPVCEATTAASYFQDQVSGTTVMLDEKCQGNVGGTAAATLIRTVSSSYFTVAGVGDRTFTIQCCVMSPSSSSTQ